MLCYGLYFLWFLMYLILSVCLCVCVCVCFVCVCVCVWSDWLYFSHNVAGSPFLLKVAGPPDASKVRVSGPGVESGILANFQSRFIVETRGAGAGQLTVRIRGPKGGLYLTLCKQMQYSVTSAIIKAAYSHKPYQTFINLNFDQIFAMESYKIYFLIINWYISSSWWDIKICIKILPLKKFTENKKTVEENFDCRRKWVLVHSLDIPCEVKFSRWIRQLAGVKRRLYHKNVNHWSYIK